MHRPDKPPTTCAFLELQSTRLVLRFAEPLQAWDIQAPGETRCGLFTHRAVTHTRIRWVKRPRLEAGCS